MRRVDITGKRSGRLVAIRPSPEHYGGPGITWECRCDCGNIVHISAGLFNQGHRKSCGCSRSFYNRQKGNRYLYKGKMMTILEIAETAGVSKSMVYNWIIKGKDLDAIGTTFPQAKDYGVGKLVNISEMADMVGITRQGMQLRIKRGWKGMDLLKPPVSPGRVCNGKK